MSREARLASVTVQENDSIETTLDHSFYFLIFLIFWDQIELFRKKRSIDLGKFGTDPRPINFSKIHLKHDLSIAFLKN